MVNKKRFCTFLSLDNSKLTCIISSTALHASSLLVATMTPFPAARPLAFTTRAGNSALGRKKPKENSKRDYVYTPN